MRNNDFSARLSHWLPPSKLVIGPGCYMEQINNCASEVVLKDLSDIFDKHEFQQYMQYASTYYTRLQYLKPRVKASAVREFPDVSILDISDGILSSEECIIIGHVYKEMKLKPRVLTDTQKQLDVDTPTNFLSSDDNILLEDATARVAIIIDPASNIDIDRLVTGVIAGFRGVSKKRYGFLATDVIYCGVPPLSSVLISKDSEENFIVIVSNIKACLSPCNNRRRLDLLTHFIAGNTMHAPLACKCARLVVLGNAIGSIEGTSQDKEGKGLEVSKLIQFSEVDLYFANLSGIIPTILISGDQDPASYSLPRMPIPRRMFMAASQSADFTTSPNPTIFDVRPNRQEGLSTRFLLYTAEPLNDILNYSSYTSQMEALKFCADIGHIAPTAPDTLSCIPLDGEDVFCLPTPDVPSKVDRKGNVLTEEGDASRYPDMIVVGGCKETAHEVYKGVTLVTVSDFQKDGILTLINVKTRSVHKLKLG